MSAFWQLSPCAGRTRLAARQWLCLILLGTTCLTGCGGCRQQTPAQQAAKKEKDAEAELEARRKKLEEEKKKQPFLVQPLTPLLERGARRHRRGRSRCAWPSRGTGRPPSSRCGPTSTTSRVA